MKLLVSTSIAKNKVDHYAVKMATLTKALEKAKGEVVAANAKVKRAQKALDAHKKSK